MARFTNFATLSYSGGKTDSNVVTGELRETLTAVKTAVMDDYTARDDVTFVLSLVNSGTAPITGLTVTDDLGGYTFNGQTLYPLAYAEGSIRYYLNGVLQTAPAVTAGSPMVITGIGIPAGGNALLIYEASVTAYAPMGLEASITNRATITGGGLPAPLTAEATINMEARAELSISKGLYPTTVTENGQLTYTFVIENMGSVPAEITDQVVLSDTFDPILNGISVTFNGAAWTEGTNYTYDPATGCLRQLRGRLPYLPQPISKTRTAHGRCSREPRHLSLQVRCSITNDHLGIKEHPAGASASAGFFV